MLKQATLQHTGAIPE